MRRAFVAFGFLIFLVYCWASIVYQNQVDVPRYRLVEIDLLGGTSRTKWNEDQQAQFQQLMELENKRYQLPEDALIPAWPGRHSQTENGMVPVDEPLTSGDFSHFIAVADGDGPVRMRLRDTSAFTNLISQNYLLRDSIDNPGYPDGPPLYMGGAPLDKPMLDDLLARGYKTITVTGHGPTVTYQLGTSIMIAIIFLTLVAALKPVLWDPFMVLLEKRKRELDMGAEAERQNQQEAIRYEEERRSRNNQLHREIQTLKMLGQNQITREANEIIKSARDQEKETKLEGLRRLAEQADAAKIVLEKDIPALAEEIANALTPGRSKPSGTALAEKGVDNG